MPVTSFAQLQEEITRLKVDAEIKKNIVREQFAETCESLKPINLIKGAFNKLPMGNIASGAIDATLGVGAGILSQKLLVGKSHNIFRKLLGSIVKIAVARSVAKNGDKITSKGLQLVKKMVN
jgi:hypothetical protein